MGSDNRSPRDCPGAGTDAYDHVYHAGRDHAADRWRSLGGDKEAFDRLYQATCAKIYGVILRILRRHDLAADVMEETYLQIWKTGGKFDPALSSPISWMVAIARARAIDLARRPDVVAERHRARGGGKRRSRRGAAARNDRGTQAPAHLHRAAEPDRQRMLLLAYYGAFTRAQLAEKLDTPMNLLKASLRRSLFEIEQCLTS